MYNRYNDITKFITDSSELKIENGSYVYISSEKDYNIAVDLENHVDEFEKLKPFIVFLAKHICELDNIVQRFDKKHYLDTSEPDILSIIYIDGNDIILEYWGATVNTEYDVVFEYKDNQFRLKSFGMIKDIPS
ncbi:MAG: hypothetical protein ACI4M3_02580, partial [Acutalibacteraceae bacterium]